MKIKSKIFAIVLVLAVMLQMIPPLAFPGGREQFAGGNPPSIEVVSSETIIGTIPLAAPVDTPVWALANLFLLVLTFLLLIVLAYRIVNRIIERKEQGARDDKDVQRKLNGGLVIIGLIAPIVSVILFFATQDMAFQIALFDLWTATFATLFIVSALATLLTISQVNYAEEEDNDPKKLIYKKSLGV